MKTNQQCSSEMRSLLTTSQAHPRDSFQYWQNAIFERIVPVELKKVGEQPFQGLLEAADLGALSLTRITQSAMRTEATPATIRRHDKHETVSAVFMLSGTGTCVHEGRESIHNSGEFFVLDRRPTVMVTKGHHRSLIVEIPRARLEQKLGPLRLYSGLTVGKGQASTSLITGFFETLTQIEAEIDPDQANRLSSIGIDLLVAGLSERIAHDAPKSLASTLLVQRANAYVEANLGDPTLDASELAIAMGISLRRLQQLFQERNQSVSGWIWHRRLEVAAARLSDPRSRFIQIGEIAYECGFTSQSHFSNRFKDRYGLSPRDYRESLHQ